jgi:D-alanine-D-alanine ligase
MQLAVIFGGPSPEHDVSILLGMPAARTLAEAGHDVTAIYWSKTSEFFAVDARAEKDEFYDGVPKKARPLVLGTRGFDGKKAPAPEVVVNCCHGGPGEDGTLQAALEPPLIWLASPTPVQRSRARRSGWTSSPSPDW